MKFKIYQMSLTEESTENNYGWSIERQLKVKFYLCSVQQLPKYQYRIKKTVPLISKQPPTSSNKQWLKSIKGN